MLPEDLKKSKVGGRPSNHSLLLTEAEHAWLSKQMSKRSEKSTSAKSSKLTKAIVSLDDKLTIPVPATPPLEGLVLKLTRDELQVINQIVGNTLTGIRDRVIPEYMKRAPTSERLVEAMALLVLLVSLHSKGTRIYDAGSHRRGNGRVQKP